MKSDSQLQQDVLAELRWEPAVNAAHVGVEVTQGVVTLRGYVATCSEQWDAERAAQRVAGVRGMVDEITVELAAGHLRPDGEIASAARNVLQWTTSLPRDTIGIDVEQGWLTLTGSVDWEFQRKAATRAVRHLAGITGVSDRIVIGTGVSLWAVKSEIEAALRRRARQDAHQIQVEVHGAAITLSGQVGSWSERALARQSAWGTPGVRSVVDRMTVTA
jgi:osmotically-inducible protein OsmY